MASKPGQNATVEEILASIRQAISEDDARRTTVPRRRPDARSASERRPVVSVSRVFDEDDDEPQDLPDAPEADAASDDEAETAAPGSDVDKGVIDLAIEEALNGVRAELEGRKVQQSKLRPRQDLVKTEPRAIPRGPRVPLPRREMPARRALLSPRVDAEVSASFDDLAKAMIEGNAHKLDEVVEDLLRPMLKGWLEGNLPQMVERLVREEIERVSRGRR
jgi:cell pole-organizing protein PopZ